MNNSIRMIQAILSDITCGANCWEAKDIVCHCSCGGKNHGISLLGKNPEKVIKIKNHRYKLLAVGSYGDMYSEHRKVCQTKGFTYSKMSGRNDYYHYNRDNLGVVRKASGGQLKWLEVTNYLDTLDEFDRTFTGCYLLFVRADFEQIEPSFCPNENCEKCNQVKASL